MPISSAATAGAAAKPSPLRRSGLSVSAVRSGSGAGWLTVLLGAIVLGSACASPPPFPATPNWDGTGEVDPAVTARFAELAAEVEQDWPALVEGLAVVDSSELDAYLHSVLDRILPRESESPFSVRFVVVDSEETHAGTWANHTIVLTTGLLAEFENAAQLAFLIGHEVVHLLERHAALSVLYEEQTDSHVYRMKQSRMLESRSDDGALEMLLRAGLPAGAAPSALAALEYSPPPEYARIRAWESHYDLKYRIRQLRRRADSREEGKEDLGRARYLEVTDSLWLDVALQCVESGKRSRAERLTDRFLARHPESGRAYYVRAQIERAFASDVDRNLRIERLLKKAVEREPEDADSLRALGILARQKGDDVRGRDLLGRYLAVRPDALDRKMIERYLRGE